MVRIVGARTERLEFMVKDKEDNIFNVDSETDYQTIASDTDDSDRKELVTKQTIRMENGRLLGQQKDGTFKAFDDGEVFEIVPDED